MEVSGQIAARIKRPQKRRKIRIGLPRGESRNDDHGALLVAFAGEIEPIPHPGERERGTAGRRGGGAEQSGADHPRAFRDDNKGAGLVSATLHRRRD